MGAIDVDLSSTAGAKDKMREQWRGRVFIMAHGRKSVPHMELVEKLILGIAAGDIAEAIFLSHNSTDTHWWHAAATRCQALCLLKKRIRFLRGADRTEAGPSPPNGQIVLYFGPQTDRFREVFGKMGSVGRPGRRWL
jgi:ParB family chromosome partitioning protein